MTTPEKALAIACWWVPLIALIVVLMRGVSSPVKRHARWALGCTILLSAIIVAVLLCLLWLRISGSATFAIVGGLGVAVAFAVLITNTVAAIADKGPFFTS